MFQTLFQPPNEMVLHGATGTLQDGPRCSKMVQTECSIATFRLLAVLVLASAYLSFICVNIMITLMITPLSGPQFVLIPHLLQAETQSQDVSRKIQLIYQFFDTSGV